MGTTLPIKSRETLERMKRYYKTEKANPRNYTLIVLATNTALRIGDLLELKWKDLYSEEYRQFYTHLSIKEKKTEKHKIVLLNHAVTDSLKYLYDTVHPGLDCYVFQSRKGKNEHISRQQAYRIVCEAAKSAGMMEHISCHSLRKTFGYHAWKNGASPAVLMKIYNHSSFQITQRYLGIEQEDMDQIYDTINL